MEKLYLRLSERTRVRIAYGVVFVIVVVCAVAAFSTIIKIRSYQEIRHKGFSATAQLIDNGDGRGLAHTGGGRRDFNFTIHYAFMLPDGREVRGADQMAKRDYSHSNRAGQSISVLYDSANPQRNRLEQSYYGSNGAYFMVLFFVATSATMLGSILLVWQHQLEPVRPVSKRVASMLYFSTAVVFVSFILL